MSWSTAKVKPGKATVPPGTTKGMPFCPNCNLPCMQRIHGIWCSRCRGWYMEFVKPSGSIIPFIRSYREGVI